MSRRDQTTHILNAALSSQINRFYLSEKLPTNVISFVIVVCDKLGDIVVSLSRGVQSTILKYRELVTPGLHGYTVMREISAYLFIQISDITSLPPPCISTINYTFSQQSRPVI